MNREEAARALAVLRSVVEKARDDTALMGWGRIWIVHAFTNGGAFIATDRLIAAGHLMSAPFIAMWAAVIAVDIASIFVLKRRRAGARTFIETQIWAIWLTFIGSVVAVGLINHLMGLKLFFLGPVIGVLSAFGFSMMGAVMGRRWYLGVLIFLGAAVAMAVFHTRQFLILGATWGLAQLAGGIWLELDRKKAVRAGGAPHLV
jgi:hypothetical protein